MKLSKKIIQEIVDHNYQPIEYFEQYLQSLDFYINDDNELEFDVVDDFDKIFLKNKSE
jgi:hypothetical protein